MLDKGSLLIDLSCTATLLRPKLFSFNPPAALFITKALIIVIFILFIGLGSLIFTPEQIILIKIQQI